MFKKKNHNNSTFDRKHWCNEHNKTQNILVDTPMKCSHCLKIVLSNISLQFIAKIFCQTHLLNDIHNITQNLLQKHPYNLCNITKRILCQHICFAKQICTLYITTYINCQINMYNVHTFKHIVWPNNNIYKTHTHILTFFPKHLSM